MDDTPLGHIVKIRMEKDRKVIKNFTEYERWVRRDWNTFKAKKQLQDKTIDWTAQINAFQNAMAKMFSKDGEQK